MAASAYHVDHNCYVLMDDPNTPEWKPEVDPIVDSYVSLKQMTEELLTFMLTSITGVAKENRGVTVRLILESEQESKGKVSFDMIGPIKKALPKEVGIYVWPLARRTEHTGRRHRAAGRDFDR